jgi:hypothetical protein
MGPKKTHLEVIKAFAALFCTSKLYDAGFSDAIMTSGIRSAINVEEMHVALAYVHGYADACRFANEYLSPRWQIAHLMGIATGTLAHALREGWSADRISRVTDTYRCELKELLSR